MPKIYYQPDEVWDAMFDNTNKGDLILLAENADFGVEIWAQLEEVISICVEIDDDEPVAEEVTNAKECEDVVSEIYDTWLDPHVLNYLDEIEPEDKEDEIQEREEELESLVYDFVVEVTQDGFQDGDYEEVLKDLKEHFLAYMWRKHGLSPYRPMMVKNKNGEDELEEYPYPIICS